MNTHNVTLSKSEYFQSIAKIELLNKLIRIHSTISPRLLMLETGCSFKDALYVLTLLFELYLANGFLLVYYRKDAGEPIQRRPFHKGYPHLPLKYQDEDRKYSIDNPDDLFYSFEFDLTSNNIQFRAESIHDKS